MYYFLEIYFIYKAILVLLESVFSLYTCEYTSSVQNLQKNTSEEETEATDASTYNLTRPSDIKQHQNCVTLWNKMSTNKEVIKTVKCQGVDRIHLHFDYIVLNPIHSFFSAFYSKCFLFLCL